MLGVTGFIGRGLPPLLADAGFSVTGVSRLGGGGVPGVDRWQAVEGVDLTSHYAVINLAGESVARRWTAANRVLFHQSRVGLTRRVVEAMGALPHEECPKVLINASAVGIYGDRGDDMLTETSPAGSGFLAGLCQEWEAAAMEAEALGVRVVCPRIGIVLGRGGQATERLMTVFKLGIGGRMGSGCQWMPWIHVEDLRVVLVDALMDDGVSGAVNCCAPAPERNRDFTRKLAAAVRRPALFPVPGFALKLALGDFGGVLLEGQNAHPAVLENKGYSFRFPNLESALADLVGDR